MDMSRLELFLNGDISMDKVHIRGQDIEKVKRDLLENFEQAQRLGYLGKAERIKTNLEYAMNSLELGKLSHEDIKSLYLNFNAYKGPVKLSDGLAFVSVIFLQSTENPAFNLDAASGGPMMRGVLNSQSIIPSSQSGLVESSTQLSRAASHESSQRGSLQGSVHGSLQGSAHGSLQGSVHERSHISSARSSRDALESSSESHASLHLSRTDRVPFFGPFTSPNSSGSFGELYKSVYMPLTEETLRTRPFAYSMVE
jgi:hypothetical protein